MTAFMMIWIGLMAIAAFGVAWVILSRFPEVFFHTHDWRLSSRARAVRTALFVGGLVSVVAATAGIVLLFLRSRPF